MSDLRFTINKSGEIRTELIGGVEYLVAPVIAIKPGVLNGELVPSEEVAAHFYAWNGRPVMLDHPQDADGNDISANAPEILQQAQAGQLFNVALTDDGALRGEVWIDKARASLMGSDGKELLRRLKGGEPVEVSTAYFRDLVASPGILDGVEYCGVARNLRPDHLAILLHEVGACSWQDGCGVPRVNNEEARMQTNVLSEARRPTYDGTSEERWTAPTLEQYLDAYPDGRPEESQVADLPSAVKRWIAGHSLLGDPEADNFRDLSFFPVVGTDGKLYAAALRAVLGGRGSQANVPEAAKESAQDMARGLLDKEFKTNRLARAFEVIASALGLRGNDESLEEFPRRVRQAWDKEHTNRDGMYVGPWIEDVRDGHVIVEAEEGLMAYPYTEDENGDIRFGQPIAVEKIYRPKQEVNLMANLRDEILENGKLGLSKAQLEALSDDVVQTLAEHLPEETSEEETPVTPTPETEPTEEQPATSQQAPSPCADEVAALRAEIEAVKRSIAVTNVQREAEEAARKAELIQALTANAACAFGKEQLEALDLATLDGLHRSLSPADYSGRGGGPSVNRDGGPYEVQLVVPLKKKEV